MSVSTDAHSGTPRGSTAKLWLALVLLIAAGVAFAWFGAGSLRPEVTETGLEFRQVKAGNGGPIGDADAALLDYELRSDDGTVLDSSAKAGGPQPFMTQAVYPGFAEGMRRMEEGGEYKLKMSPKLAFPDGKAPSGFPANTHLNFTVQVRKVVRGGAAMLRQQMMMQQMQQMQQQGGPPPQ
ncbi:MAG: FKBP-type peptidyl-prolyl cis-trans isomerase [Sphingomicrobium sp.]